ncbi:hypothetical protein CFA77_06940 [Hyphomonas sp. KY3]|nr:hypothetical protein CFA77_06940 [Hyphomonas sp. KY3]|tara:strand:- start:7517 stop:8029 length:513 start_codon:yes stop_codon:yes gene_type:complete
MELRWRCYYLIKMIYRLLDKLVLLLSAEEDKTSPTVPDSDKGIASRKSILIGQFNALDSKSGALLTHISIMIGVLSLMTSPLNAGVSIFERNFLVLALLLYLFAAILCIRCNKLTTTHVLLEKFEGEWPKDLAWLEREFIAKRQSFKFATHLVVWVTILFAVFLTLSLVL